MFYIVQLVASWTSIQNSDDSRHTPGGGGENGNLMSRQRILLYGYISANHRFFLMLNSVGERTPHCGTPVSN